MFPLLLRLSLAPSQVQLFILMEGQQTFNSWTMDGKEVMGRWQPWWRRSKDIFFNLCAVYEDKFYKIISSTKISYNDQIMKYFDQGSGIYRVSEWFNYVRRWNSSTRSLEKNNTKQTLHHLQIKNQSLSLTVVFYLEAFAVYHH